MWLGTPQSRKQGPRPESQVQAAISLKVGGEGRNPLDRDVVPRGADWAAGPLSVHFHKLSQVSPGAWVPQSHATDEAGTFRPLLVALCQSQTQDSSSSCTVPGREMPKTYTETYQPSPDPVLGLRVMGPASHRSATVLGLLQLSGPCPMGGHVHFQRVTSKCDHVAWASHCKRTWRTLK